ncbi:MAG: hypothetical protein IT186_22365 [Acidobacteria bacterium]|nr:hypothetical protein [Acidobacteriota bacterium]
MTVTERFEDTAKVKGTMLRAHLNWASNHAGLSTNSLGEHLSPAAAHLLGQTVLATDWVTFGLVVEIDRAIATASGRPEEDVYRDLGRYSAALNLGGVYKAFVSVEPHRFFERMTVLHHQFQNFGRSTYERKSERSGRIRIDGYTAYSRVFCLAGMGYYEEALRLMHAPGPIRIQEAACHCFGDDSCSFDISW